MARRDYTGNAVPTTLTAGINATDLSISIASAVGWPSGGASGKFYVTIDRGLSTEERVLVNSRSGTTLTVANTSDRGVDDTSAASHGTGSSIEHTFSAVDADEANLHVNTAGLHLGVGTINNSNMFAAGVVDAAAIAADAVGSSEIAANAVGNAELANDAVTAAKIANDAVGSTEIATGAVGTTELADDSVTSAKIAADAVGTSEIAADAVTSSEIAADAVGTSEIAALAVGTAELADNAVTLAKMADDSVGTAELIALAVGTAELANDAVTIAKVAHEAWTNFNPNFANVTLGGGTQVGRYIQYGRIVIGYARFTLGAAGDVTGDISFTVPVTCANNTDIDGLCAGRATATANRATGIGVILPGGTTAFSFATFGTAIWGATSPFDWNANDIGRFWFLYEAAT